MKETKVFKKLKKIMSPLVWRLTRIENILEDGTPDTFCQSIFGSFWIELKQVKKKILKHNTAIRPRWQPGQIGWAMDHIRYKGTWFLIIAINDKLYIIDEPKEVYYFNNFKKIETDLDIVNMLKTKK